MFRKNKLINDNQSVSSMSVHGASITTVSPDGESIPRKKVKNKLSEISITGNKITQEPDYQSKKSKVGSIIDETKINVKLAPPPNTNKQDYKGGTNDKTHDYQICESGSSRSDTDSCE